MISYRELREISLDFRRLSSNLLNATHETADVQLERFKQYIDTIPFVQEKIAAITKEVDFDHTQCFVREHGGGWLNIQVPTSERCHVKAMYDYIAEVQADKGGVFKHARAYSHKTKFNEMVRGFLSDAFKPLIDFINDAISKEMILLEEERRIAQPPITQHFGTFYGTFNQQGSGTITSYNTTNASAADIVEILDKILPSLDYIQDVPQDVIDDIKDDLESVTEQIVASNPKKNRLQKALAGVKKFTSDFAMKLAVTWATGAVTSTDWDAVIKKLQAFISTLG